MLRPEIAPAITQFREQDVYAVIQKIRKNALIIDLAVATVSQIRGYFRDYGSVNHGATVQFHRRAKAHHQAPNFRVRIDCGITFDYKDDRFFSRPNDRIAGYATVTLYPD